MTICHDYWKENEAKEVEFLDSIPYDDLNFYLDTGKTIYKLKNEIAEKWEDSYQKTMGTDECLFNWLLCAVR